MTLQKQNIWKLLSIGLLLVIIAIGLLPPVQASDPIHVIWSAITQLIADLDGEATIRANTDTVIIQDLMSHVDDLNIHHSKYTDTEAIAAVVGSHTTLTIYEKNVMITVPAGVKVDRTMACDDNNDIMINAGWSFSGDPKETHIVASHTRQAVVDPMSPPGGDINAEYFFAVMNADISSADFGLTINCLVIPGTN